MSRPVRIATNYKVNNSGCWIWQGGTDKAGYGTCSFRIDMTSYRQKRVGAHRYFYELHKGPIGDLCVLHRCDVPLCVNPEHLFLGTRRDNLYDMRAKGRMAPRHGKFAPNRKLTEEQAIAILNSGISVTSEFRVTAAEYGVSMSCIRDLVRGRSWRYLTHKELRVPHLSRAHASLQPPSMPAP